MCPHFGERGWSFWPGEVVGEGRAGRQSMWVCFRRGMELCVLWGGHPHGPSPLGRATREFPLMRRGPWEGRGWNGLAPELPPSPTPVSLGIVATPWRGIPNSGLGHARVMLRGHCKLYGLDEIISAFIFDKLHKMRHSSAVLREYWAIMSTIRSKIREFGTNSLVPSVYVPKHYGDRRPCSL